MTYSVQNDFGRELNRLYSNDLPVHEWYRFVLSYPPHLVRAYLEKVPRGGCVLDPFCGTGTTLVEAKKAHVSSIGIEAHPFTHFAATTKTSWDVDAGAVLKSANEVSQAVKSTPLEDYVLDPEAHKLLITGSISDLPLQKSLRLLHHIGQADAAHQPHLRLALAKLLPTDIGNLRFGPEVGIGETKHDAQVENLWMEGVHRIVRDLHAIEADTPPATVIHGDARSRVAKLEPLSIDAVITSPPYPNEKDYTRTTRLETVLLGFIKNRKELKQFKQGLMRSNTRNVYKGDDDGSWVADNAEVQKLADHIEQTRIQLNKTSGFERLYGQVVRLYFGGMARHLGELRPALKPGAQLAYVVGDQASFFRVMIRTGKILSSIAKSLGYVEDGIVQFRSRFSTATQDHLNEEIVLLRWPG